jgi:hypothetical protein
MLDGAVELCFKHRSRYRCYRFTEQHTAGVALEGAGRKRWLLACSVPELRNRRKLEIDKPSRCGKLAP